MKKGLMIVNEDKIKSVCTKLGLPSISDKAFKLYDRYAKRVGHHHPTGTMGGCIYIASNKLLTQKSIAWCIGICEVTIRSYTKKITNNLGLKK